MSSAFSQSTYCVVSSQAFLFTLKRELCLSQILKQSHIKNEVRLTRNRN